jgi:hypothetical protein
VSRDDDVANSEPNVQSVMALLSWVEATGLSEFMRESEWAFPAVESAHVIALALVIGTISIVDLRLLGLASTTRAYSELAAQVLPWTWGAFALAAISGVLMFTGQPKAYFDNVAFRIKFTLMLLAGINMLVFQLLTSRGAAKWDRQPSAPLAGKIAGALSLAFWIAIVFFGRRIGFTMISA